MYAGNKNISLSTSVTPPSITFYSHIYFLRPANRKERDHNWIVPLNDSISLIMIFVLSFALIVFLVKKMDFCQPARIGDGKDED
jgi:hypothetical protein